MRATARARPSAACGMPHWRRSKRHYVGVVNTADVDNEIRQFIVENFLFGDSSAAPKPDQQLVQSGLVDSTGILEIVSFLESKFAIQTADDELAAENFGTVATIARFVVTKKA